MVNPQDVSNTSPSHILVVDDEPFIRNAFKLYLETHGYRVSTASGGEQALKVFRDEADPVDLVLLDLVMPGLHGLEVLRQFKAECSLVEVIIATGCGNMNSAIEALRLGAFDYITKPIVDFDRDLLSVIQKALVNRRTKLEQISAVQKQPETESWDALARFYNNMESLAASLSHSTTRDAALSVIESFFEQHFSAVGGLVTEHAEASVSFLYGWGVCGNALEDDFALPDNTQVDFWRPLLRSTSRWEEIDAALAAPAATRGELRKSLEVLRIPLVPATDESGRSTNLFVFRPRQVGATPPPAQTALLALVVNSALSRSIAAPVT